MSSNVGPERVKCLCSRIFLIRPTAVLERCHIIKYSIYQTVPILTQVLARNFFPCVSFGHKCNLVCCHNDTLVSINSRLHNYFKCLWNCECYVPCCACSCLFTYFGYFGSHYNSLRGSVKSRLQNVKSHYPYAYWKVPTSERLDLWAIFLNC